MQIISENNSTYSAENFPIELGFAFIASSVVLYVLGILLLLNGWLMLLSNVPRLTHSVGDIRAGTVLPDRTSEHGELLLEEAQV